MRFFASPTQNDGAHGCCLFRRTIFRLKCLLTLRCCVRFFSVAGGGGGWGEASPVIHRSLLVVFGPYFRSGK